MSNLLWPIPLFPHRNYGLFLPKSYNVQSIEEHHYLSKGLLQIVQEVVIWRAIDVSYNVYYKAPKPGNPILRHCTIKEMINIVSILAIKMLFECINLFFFKHLVT